VCERSREEAHGWTPGAAATHLRDVSAITHLLGFALHCSLRQEASTRPSKFRNSGLQASEQVAKLFFEESIGTMCRWWRNERINHI
jgi:hypothetical protein